MGHKTTVEELLNEILLQLVDLNEKIDVLSDDEGDDAAETDSFTEPFGD